MVKSLFMTSVSQLQTLSILDCNDVFTFDSAACMYRDGITFPGKYITITHM